MGDEPHYLIITQSLLRDGDIRIENNHQRGDYRAYFAGELPPHSVRLGRNGQMYSIRGRPNCSMRLHDPVSTGMRRARRQTRQR